MHKNISLIYLAFVLLFFCKGLQAQNASVNNTGTAANASAMLDVSAANKGLLIPRVSLVSASDVSTIASPATSLLVYNLATSGTAPDNVVPGYYYWNGSRWTSFGGKVASLLTFSTGIILNGSSVTSAAPVLMGFGNHTTETINFTGESTMPPETGGFSFPIPFNGVLQNLQVSSDLLVVSSSSINTLGLQYDFTVFVASSVINNGIDHPSAPYITTPLTSSVRFGFPNTLITPGTFRTATNINLGSLVVNAGDRIGIRIRTNQSTDPSASDVTQLSFSATLTYTQQ